MYEAMVVARLFLSNGVEAIAGTTTHTEHEFDKATFHAAALMAPFVLGRDAFDTRTAYAEMRKRYVPLGHLATSLFDIALHDGKARSVNLPIYKMLGAARHKVPTYASSPVLPSDRLQLGPGSDQRHRVREEPRVRRGRRRRGHALRLPAI